MYVNKENTKVLVSKRGGRLSRRKKLYYYDIRLECFSGFTYVGMYFSNTLSLYKMAEQSAVCHES